MYFTAICLAWDRLEPNADQNYRLRNSNDISTRKTSMAPKPDLVENFTEFIQKKLESKEFRIALVAQDVWSKLDEDFKNRKLQTPTHLTTDYSKIKTSTHFKTKTETDEIDIVTNSLEALNILHKYTTKSYLSALRRTVFPEAKNAIVKDNADDDKSKEEKELQTNYKLLKEPDIEPLMVMRRYATNNSLELVTDFPNESLYNILANVFNEHPQSKHVLKQIHYQMAKTSQSTTKNYLFTELITKPRNGFDIEEKSEENHLSINKPSDEKSVSLKNGDLKRYQSLKKNITSNTDTSVLSGKKYRENDEEHKMKYEKILNRENQIIDILHRQTELLEQVARILDAGNDTGDKESIRSINDFENLLSELDKKRQLLDKNTNMTQKALETVQKKFKELHQNSRHTLDTYTRTTPTGSINKKLIPTVKTMIDETEVRKALKNDPYVQRILKMAKNKRTRYVKNAVRQL